MLDRRGLLGRLLGLSLVPKILTTDTEAVTSLPERAASLHSYTTKLKPLTMDMTLNCDYASVIRNIPQLEVFHKNMIENFTNSQDASIINTKTKGFGVTLYIDPAGIFTNEVTHAIFVSV